MRTLFFGMMFLSTVASAKGVMLDGTFQMGTEDNGFRVQFVTVNQPGTTTRMAACSALPCQRSTKVTAFCPKTNKPCEILRDVVVVTTQPLAQIEGEYRWRVVYAFVDPLGELSYFGELEAGTFGSNPTWRFARGSTPTPLVPVVR